MRHLAYALLGAAALIAAASAAQAQIRPPDQNWVPYTPTYNPPAPPSTPAPTTQHGVDAAGNAVDTTTTYRSGPFGTYTDHVTTTTYPPGNPALGTSVTH